MTKWVNNKMQKSLETICLQKLENPPFVQMIQIRGPEGGIKCVMATIAPIRSAEHPIMMEYGWYSDKLLVTPLNISNGTPSGRHSRDLRATLPINAKGGFTTVPCVNYIVLYKNDDADDQHEIYGYRACMDGFHCKHTVTGMERFELCDSYAGHMSAYRYLSHIAGSPLYEFEEPLETYYGFKPAEYW